MIKVFVNVTVFVFAMSAGLVASFLITWFAWQMQITEKAFHCVDDNLCGFWVDMNTHRDAGDTVMPGWSWKKLEAVRLVYESVFYGLWILGGLFAFQVYRRLSKPRRRARQGSYA